VIRERERCPSLGSQRVSQQILRNPRLGYTQMHSIYHGGLARGKIWFKNEVFETPFETFWNINMRKERVQSLEKWRESLKGTTWEQPIEASQGQSHVPTKEALEACPWTHPNPQEKESKNLSIRKNLMLGSRVFMLWEKLWSLNESTIEKSHKPNSHKNEIQVL
jgi:hypothetical protein